MGVFCVLLIGPMLIQHIALSREEIDRKKKNDAAITFFFVVFAILLMFRHETVGNDTHNYIYFFNRVSSLDWVETGRKSVEFGYSYFNKAISIFTDNHQVFLSVAALCTVAMIYPTYRRMCVDPSLTIVLFCTMSTFVVSFSAVRQMIAVGIGFVAYEFTRRRKPWLFLICVVLAITFHTSAFMLIFMYPVYHAKITKAWTFPIVITVLTVFLFNRQIFSVLSIFIERYTKYDTTVSSTSAYAMIFLFAVFLAFAFLMPDESKIDQETIGLRNFLLLSLIVQMFAPLHTIAMRMNYYYIIFIPLLIPKIIEHKSIQMSEIAVLGRNIMVVFFLGYFFYNSYTSGALNVFPYHFFWENVI